MYLLNHSKDMSHEYKNPAFRFGYEDAKGSKKELVYWTTIGNETSMFDSGDVKTCASGRPSTPEKPPSEDV